MIELPTPETDALFVKHGYPVEVDSSTAMQLCEKLEQERDEARELARNLYWAGWDLRRFARAYANGYDEADGKAGAIAADYAFYEASQNLAEILGEATETPPDEVHCTCVPLLLSKIAALRKERDEARAPVD